MSHSQPQPKLPNPQNLPSLHPWAVDYYLCASGPQVRVLKGHPKDPIDVALVIKVLDPRLMEAITAFARQHAEQLNALAIHSPKEGIEIRMVDSYHQDGMPGIDRIPEQAEPGKGE